MLYTKIAYALAFTVGALANPSPANNNANSASSSSANANAAAGGSSGTALSADAIQTGSFVDGSEASGSEAGQAASQISQNNFINNCAGKTLTNGLQITTGSCNGITMGDIPAKTAMVSSVITFPTTGGQAINSDTTFNISVQMANIVAGSFTNADSTYYAAPQALSGGKVVGHTHVTVQDLGSNLNPTQALDATQFAFFKGINDAGNGQGLLQAEVAGGLPAGNYRVCTMASASNHQPVLMPVAQRGTSDDCTKFVVSGSGTTANAASNNGATGDAAAAAAAAAVVAATDPAAAASESAAAAASASSTSAASATAAAGNGGAKAQGTGTAGAAGAKGGAGGAKAVGAGAGGAQGAQGAKGGKGRKQRFARRQFVA